MPKPLVTFTVSPSTIKSGESALLTWNALFSTFTIITKIGVVTSFGEQLVSPTSTTTYELTATNPEGTTTASVTLTVEEPDEPIYGGEITSLTASVNPVEKGKDTTIKATLKNIGTTRKAFITNIRSDIRGEYWSEWKWLDPGGTYDFSRKIKNIQKDEWMVAALWQWVDPDSVLSHWETIWIYLTGPPHYTLTLITTPGKCRFELLDKDGYEVVSGITLADGSMVIENLPEMRYTLTVSKSGYNDYVKVFTLSIDTELKIKLDESSIWDWIIGFVLSGIEGLLGIQKGTLITMLGNVWDFFTNSVGAIYDFFADVVGSIVDVIKDNVGDIFDWLSTAFFDFIDWIVEIGGDIAGFVTDKISGALDFLTDKIGAFFDWVGDLVGSVADYIGGAIGDFVDWSADQLGSIWDGIVKFFTEAISGFVEAFFGGLNTGIEQAKTSPLHSDEPVRNPVLKGLQKVVREHRKKYGRDEITGEKKHGTI